MVVYKNFEIYIEQDHVTGSSPRKEYETLSVISSWDKDIDCECFDKPHDDVDINPENDWDLSEDIKFERRLAYYITNVKIVAILPLYRSYNSFNTIGIGKQMGLVYMKRDIFNKNYDQAWIDKFHPNKSKGDIARDILKGEIKMLSQWANGEVYGFRIDKLDDSCWGFYGDNHEESGLLETARETIDWEVYNKTKHHLKRLKHMIRNKVSLNKRIAYEYS